MVLVLIYPGNLKKNLVEVNRTSNLSWSMFKNEADIIVSTLKEAGQSLYDILPSGKSVPVFNPSVPPLKSGSTTPVHPPTTIPNLIAHKAIDTNATETTNGVPISEKYKVIPALKQFECL